MVQLVQLVLTGKEEQRDICSIGLKTVVLEVPQSMATAAVRHLAPKLVSGVSKDLLEVKLECMDILNDLLKRFVRSPPSPQGGCGACTALARTPCQHRRHTCGGADGAQRVCEHGARRVAQRHAPQRRG